MPTADEPPDGAGPEPAERPGDVLDPRAEVSLGAPASRMSFLAGMGVILGVVGGIAAYLIVRLVGLISNLALLHRVAFDLPDLRHYHPTVVLVPIALGGAVVIALLARWSPVIKGHGIPESIEAVLFRDARIQPRAAVAKPVSAAIAMGTGGPFGAEGPIIVTGASIGSLLGQLLTVTSGERRILLAVGAAAGMAGVFATPVAAVVLAFELLLFERSLRALLPLVLATSIAAALHEVLIGAHPLFAVTRDLTVPASHLPLYVVLGVAVGVLAVILNKGLFLIESLYARLPIPTFWHPVLGALGYALIGLLVPGTLSVGYWAITDAVNDRFLLGAAAVLCVAKLLSWWVALGSNTSGGTLAPMFLVGATMGEVIGIGFAHLIPGAHIQPGAFALVAMGASFGVGARALLTGVVFAAEVTGGFGMLLPLLLATGVAELIVERGLTERIMTDKLFRRGYRVNFDTEADPFRSRVAGLACTPAPVDRADPDAPVPDDATAPGRAPRPAPGAAGDHATSGNGTGVGATIDRWATLADALPLFLDEERDEVRVVDQGRVVGILTRQALRDTLERRVGERRLQAPTLGWRRHQARSTGGAEETDGTTATGNDINDINDITTATAIVAATALGADADAGAQDTSEAPTGASPPESDTRGEPWP